VLPSLAADSHRLGAHYTNTRARNSEVSGLETSANALTAAAHDRLWHEPAGAHYLSRLAASAALHWSLTACPFRTMEYGTPQSGFQSVDDERVDLA